MGAAAAVGAAVELEGLGADAVSTADSGCAGADPICCVTADCAGETAFHSAWRDLGGQDSPFTVEEISQRYAWLSAKFMEMGAQ